MSVALVPPISLQSKRTATESCPQALLRMQVLLYHAAQVSKPNNLPRSYIPRENVPRQTPRQTPQVRQNFEMKSHHCEKVQAEQANNFQGAQI